MLGCSDVVEEEVGKGPPSMSAGRLSVNVATSVPGSTRVKSTSPSTASVSSVIVMSTRPATRSSGSPSIPVSVSVTAIATGSAAAAVSAGAALSAGACCRPAPCRQAPSSPTRLRHPPPLSRQTVRPSSARRPRADACFVIHEFLPCPAFRRRCLCSDPQARSSLQCEARNQWLCRLREVLQQRRRVRAR